MDPILYHFSILILIGGVGWVLGEGLGYLLREYRMTKESGYINPKLLAGFVKYLGNAETKLQDPPNGEVDLKFEEALAGEGMPRRQCSINIKQIDEDDEWEWELEDVTRAINKLRIEIDMLVTLLAEKNDAWQDKEHYRQMIYREQLKKEKI